MTFVNKNMSIKELREQRGMKQKELAQLIGIHQGVLSQIENGKVEMNPFVKRRLENIFGDLNKENRVYAKNYLVEELQKAFPNMHVNKYNEAIILPTKNIYFRLGDCKDRRDIVVKLIHWCTRLKAMTMEEKQYMKDGLNLFFRKTFTLADYSYIYAALGNGIDSRLTDEFIRRGFDLNLIERPIPKWFSGTKYDFEKILERE